MTKKRKEERKRQGRRNCSYALIPFTINNYKTFSVLIYSYINTSGIRKTRNCVETRRPKGGVFSYNFEFPRLSRVLI